MDKSYKFKVITKRGVVLEKDILSFTAKTSSGEIQFLAHHAETLIKTLPNTCRYIDTNNIESFIQSDEGVVLFKNNTLKFCCDNVNES